MASFIVYLRGIAFMLAFVLFSAIACVILLPAWPILMFVDPQWRFANRLVVFLVNLAIKPFFTVHVRGKENVPRNPQHLVVVCNHQSTLDPAVLSPLHFFAFTVIIKAELLFYPFIGQAMWLAGYLPVWRGDKSSGHNLIARAKELVQRGRNVLFFPEGTRKVDVSAAAPLGEFKVGAFKVATETPGAAVLPITISGARSLFPLSIIPRLNFGDPVLTIHPVISAEGKTATQLSEEVKAVIASALREVDFVPAKAGRVASSRSAAAPATAADAGAGAGAGTGAAATPHDADKRD